MTETYAAEFEMFRRTPIVCRAPDYARAFLYAVAHGWLPPGDLSDGGPAIDSAADHANEKLVARLAFIKLLMSTPEPMEPADAIDLIAALENAPESWLLTSRSWPFIENLGRATRDTLPPEAADRLSKVAERIVRLEGNEP